MTASSCRHHTSVRMHMHMHMHMRMHTHMLACARVPRSSLSKSSARVAALRPSVSSSCTLPACSTYAKSTRSVYTGPLRICDRRECGRGERGRCDTGARQRRWRRGKQRLERCTYSVVPVHAHAHAHAPACRLSRRRRRPRRVGGGRVSRGQSATRAAPRRPCLAPSGSPRLPGTPAARRHR